VKRSHSVHLLIIPLLIAVWLAFLSFNGQRTQSVIAAYQSVQRQVVLKAARNGEDLFAKGVHENTLSLLILESRFMEQVVRPIQLLHECSVLVTRDRHVYTSTLPDTSIRSMGRPARELFADQEEEGARDYQSLLNGLDAGSTGTASFTWSAERGPEHAAWASFKALGQTWTIVASTPESAILNFSGIPLQIRREAFILITVSLLFLLIMAVMARQQRLSARYRDQLEQIVTDRTAELTQANQRLRASEEKYRLLVEHQNDMVVRVSRMGRLEFVSPSFCDLLGQREETLLGSRILALIHADDRRKAFEAMGTPEGPSLAFNVQIRMHTRLGLRWLSWTGKPLPAGDGGTPAEFVGIGRDITDMVLAGERIANSLAEKEVLLQEVHHRVKNNLQVICSLLDMASRRLHSDQDKELFQDVHSKIEGMSLIHTQLYQSERFDSIDMGQYVLALFAQLSKMFGKSGVRLDLDAEKVFLPINRAIPCGLVLNEILTNVFKHAYPGDLFGTVRIRLGQADGQVRLRVADDGPGLPEDWESRGAKSMGMKLMKNIVEFQLGGRLKVSTGPGGAFEIKFPPQQN